MTDEPRRRTNDLQAADVYEAVRNMQDTLTSKLAPVDHGHDEIGQIIDILEGPAVPQPFNQPAIRNDGLVDKVNRIDTKVSAIEEKLGNGGVRIKLPVAAWVAISIAIIAGVFQVVAAAVS